MYTYKYYIETKALYSEDVLDVEVTVEYKNEENGMYVISETVTKVVRIETKKEINLLLIPYTIEHITTNCLKPWDELEAELWSDWDDKQIFD